MTSVFWLVLAMTLLIIPVSADNTTPNTTPTITPIPTPFPLVFSFQGGHVFGENPVEFVDPTGRTFAAWNTSSKGIELPPDSDYIIRVEPSGFGDAMNAPDAGVIGVMKWAEKNPLGTFVGSLLITIFLIGLKGRKK
jgi:hypothetical protein